jgi:hypothetical protein
MMSNIDLELQLCKCSYICTVCTFMFTTVSVFQVLLSCWMHHDIFCKDFCVLEFNALFLT